MSVRQRSEGIHLKGQGTGATQVVLAAFTPSNAQQFVAVAAIILTANAAGTVTLQDTNGNALSGALNLVAGIPFILPVQHNYDPWFTTRDVGPNNNGAGLQLAQGTPANIISWDVYYLPTQ